jgi:hypothetical protein
LSPLSRRRMCEFSFIFTTTLLQLPDLFMTLQLIRSRIFHSR